MKLKLTIAFTLIFTFQCFAQNDSLKLPFNKAGFIEYEEIVPVIGISDTTLFSRAKIALANIFVSAKDVTQLSDDVSKTVITKGLVEVYGKDRKNFMGTFSTKFGYVSFSMQVQCKNGKYRYIITDLVHKGYPGMNSTYVQMENGGPLENEMPNWHISMMGKKKKKEYWNECKKYTDQQIKYIIADLKLYMIGKTNSTKQDW